MELILIEPVKKLGQIGKIVKVKDGYGRNFLLPMKKAIRATPENKEYYKAKEKEIQARNNELEGSARKVHESVNCKIYTSIKQASDDGRLFGSLTAKEITKLIDNKEITSQHVALNAPIKTIGVHEVEIMLHPNVDTKVIINIARTESEAQDAIRSFEEQSKKDEPKEV